MFHVTCDSLANKVVVFNELHNFITTCTLEVSQYYLHFVEWDFERKINSIFAEDKDLPQKLV